MLGSYSATKRSLEIIAETLRLEIAPFNVSVLSIVTGAVLTQGQSYFEEFALPANSRYKVVEDKVRARAQGTEFGKAGLHKMSLEEYSSQAVKAILGRECGKVWLGAHAEDVRMATAPAVGQDVLVSPVPFYPVLICWTGRVVRTGKNGDVLIHLFTGCGGGHQQWIGPLYWRSGGD